MYVNREIASRGVGGGGGTAKTMTTVETSIRSTKETEANKKDAATKTERGGSDKALDVPLLTVVLNGPLSLAPPNKQQRRLTL